MFRNLLVIHASHQGETRTNALNVPFSPLVIFFFLTFSRVQAFRLKKKEKVRANISQWLPV